MKSHDIKNRLEERTIAVSENSWEKLAGKLDANDQKKRGKKFYYPYAACLALLISAFVFMFLKNDGIAIDETIVDVEKTIKQNKESKTPIILKEEIDHITFKEVLVESEEVKQPKQLKSTVTKKTQSITNQTKKQLETELQKEVKNAIVINKIDTVLKEAPKKIETIVAQEEVELNSDKELKASIAALSAEEKVEITFQEIDQLLKEAQGYLKELDVKKEETTVLRFATADELLNDVEYELDMSFKQKVFELIKEKVKKRNTVVVKD
ncbi:MAG: hypothetical protein AB8B65_20330 [Kordia sp.]|uniref:hypothetical protein n=1 Tax=Kordia sp. TaxID=1965332 RepID=UPI00385BF692